MNTGSIVTLDVGGTKFKTQKSTLTKYPGTFFQGLIDSNNESEYFIDRDGELFRSVLHYLRTEKLETYGNSRISVIEEFEYYAIPCNFEKIPKCAFLQVTVTHDYYNPITNCLNYSWKLDPNPWIDYKLRDSINKPTTTLDEGFTLFQSFGYTIHTYQYFDKYSNRDILFHKLY
jgi:hypothetical protein